MSKRNVLMVLSGPSGVGKGTIAKELVKRNRNISLSISCTTRQPRSGEVDGREYFFLDKKEFLNKISEGSFLEYSEHFENIYGTPKDFVLQKLKEKDVLLEIDVDGGLMVKEHYPDAVLVMLLPPSEEELKNRLIKRSTETEEEINLRMKRISYELAKKDLYDYSVINDKLEDAVFELERIVKKEKDKQ